MRTYLIRSMLAVALLITFAAAPAVAQQPVTRGKVVDEAGKPVPDAVVTFVAQFQTLTRTAKTDGKGEFLIVGLPSGQFAITATKEGVGTDKPRREVTQGQNPPVTLTLKVGDRAAGPLAVTPAGESAEAKASGRSCRRWPRRDPTH